MERRIISLSEDVFSTSVKVDRALDRLHEIIAATSNDDAGSSSRDYKAICDGCAGKGCSTCVSAGEIKSLLEAHLRALVPAVTAPILAAICSEYPRAAR